MRVWTLKRYHPETQKVESVMVSLRQRATHDWLEVAWARWGDNAWLEMQDQADVPRQRIRFHPLLNSPGRRHMRRTVRGTYQTNQENCWRGFIQEGGSHFVVEYRPGQSLLYDWMVVGPALAPEKE